MKRPLFIILSMLLVVVTLLAACSSAANREKLPATPAAPSVPSFAPVPAPAAPPSIVVTGKAGGGGVAVTPGLAQPETSQASPAGQNLDTERKIVRTANMALVVEDVPATIVQISAMAVKFTGFVVSSNVLGDKERMFGNISIRIPAERFDEVMNALRALAIQVSSETTNSQDVTEEFVDLNARLKNLQATEAQLLLILQKADKVTDILAVQRELSNVRSQIEQTKGRIQFLERTSATSLINVSLQQSKLGIDFAASQILVKDRQEIHFSVSVSGGITPYSYNWDLGDGTTSNEANPSHSYKKAGSYTVKLTVTDDRNNTATKTRPDYITVIPGWSAGNTVTSAWDGLVGFGRGLANVVIWLVVFSPVWIVLAVVAYAVFRSVRRRKKTP